MQKPSALLFTVSVVVGSLLSLEQVGAVGLSKEALYHRCFKQITGSGEPPNDANLADFRAGKGDPIATCLQILDRAQLTANSNTRIGSTSDVLGKKALARMHAVHSNWIQEKDFRTPNRSTREGQAPGDLIDPTTPALYFTRALFVPNLPASSIVTDSANYKPVRTNMDPSNGRRSGAPKAEFYFNGEADYVLAPFGELLGVIATGLVPITYKQISGSNAGATRLAELGRTLGGGAFGTPAYLLETINEEIGFKSDLLRMPRRWSKALFNDFLCRELPVVRSSDAQSFVVTSSAIGFRKDVACTQCHVTMDRAASLIRGFTYRYVGHNTVQEQTAPIWFDIAAPTQSAESGWPANIDNNYSLRPATGTFYLRSVSDGSLINSAVTSVAQLGQKISQTDDFYICLASRYWNYFTETNVKVDEPSVMSSRPQSEQARFAVVRSLGVKLRTHQSLRQLVEEILRRPEYADSAFGN